MNKLEISVAHIRQASIESLSPDFKTVWCQYCAVGKGRIILLFTLFTNKGYTMHTLEFNNFVQVKEKDKEPGVFIRTPAFDAQVESIISNLRAKVF